jgi:hypothetical protein
MDELKVKVGNSLCKLFLALFTFEYFVCPPTKRKSKHRIFATFKGA